MDLLPFVDVSVSNNAGAAACVRLFRWRSARLPCSVEKSSGRHNRGVGGRETISSRLTPWEASMPCYRLYRLSHDDGISGAGHHIECPNDSAALRLAALQIGTAAAIEVWCGVRMVGTVPKVPE
jgi:hypothetical protein